MKAQYEIINPNKGKGLSVIAKQFKSQIDDLKKYI
jgi:hypothetical protein